MSSWVSRLAIDWLAPRKACAFRTRALAAVGFQRQTQHQRVRLVLTDHPDDRADQRGTRCDREHRQRCHEPRFVVADGQAGPLVTEIDREVSHARQQV